MGDRPVYMTKLRDSRVRRLPPMTPIREVSGAQTPETSAKPSIKWQKPAQTGADRLKLDELPEEYRYLATDYRSTVDPRRASQWDDQDVNRVVQHYLNAATHGGDPQEPTPNKLCSCCNDINQENKLRGRNIASTQGQDAYLPHTLAQDKYLPPYPQPSNAPHPPMPGNANAFYKPIKFEEPLSYEYSGDVDMYRSESPELMADPKGRREYEESVLDNRKIFVTHPAKKSLYSKWGVRNEIEYYGQERVLAEDVVQASANFIDAMEKLKSICSPR